MLVEQQKKGVQVGNFREIRFSCLHSLGNSSILTHWPLFFDASEVDLFLCFSHLAVVVLHETVQMSRI